MKYTFPTIILIIVCAAVLMAGCTQQAPAPTTPVPTTKAATVAKPVADSIKVGNDATLGKYLVDSSGITLYYYALDKKGNTTSACTGTCAGLWPSFYAEKVVVKAPLDQSDFDVITRPDGLKQTTYKGLPLYQYLKDYEEGDVYGHGVDNAWVVANINGTVKITKTLATPTRTVAVNKTPSVNATVTRTLTLTPTETPEEEETETPQVTSTPTTTKTVTVTATKTRTVTATPSVTTTTTGTVKATATVTRTTTTSAGNQTSS